MPIYDPIIAQRATATLGQRLRNRRKELKLAQTVLAQRAGINQGYLSEIERDRRTPSNATLQALAVALDLPPAVLVGAGPEHDNPQPLEVQHLPLLGAIPAGPPATAHDQLQLFPVLRHLWTPQHYCLRLTYDSMEPTLKPGDIVLVHYRPDVEPALVQGRICACLVNAQPTLKRVSVEAHANQNLVVLRSDNPAIHPQIIQPDDRFTIQGVVTALVSRDL